MGKTIAMPKDYMVLSYQTHDTYVFRNEEKTLREWAEIYDLNKNVIYQRLKRGSLFQEAIEKEARYKAPKQINLMPIITQEREDLNMEAVNDFFNHQVGEGSNEDINDTETRVNALKRSFNLLYRKQ